MLFSYKLLYCFTYFFQRIVMEFLPLEIVAEYHGISKASLKSLFYKNYNGKNIKFKIDYNGELFVNLDYKYPLANKLDELRQKALETAKNEHNLSIELSKITGKKVDTIQRYFIRYTFKQVEIAEEMISALKTYIAKNSLFGLES